MTSYFGCCGMCIHMNLYDRYSSFSKKFKCARSGHYYDCDEKGCNRFEGDPKKSYEIIEKAREGRL